MIDRLQAVIVKLVPSGLSRGLSAEAAAEALRRVRPRDALRRTLRAIAADLVTELRRLDRRIAETTQALSDTVAASATTLTDLLGIGDVVAAKILARTGAITRFRPRRPSPPTAAWPRSKSHPETSFGTGSPAQATASSTTRCTSWPLPRSDTTAPAATTTSANAPPGRVTKRQCAA